MHVLLRINKDRTVTVMNVSLACKRSRFRVAVASMCTAGALFAAGASAAPITYTFDYEVTQGSNGIQAFSSPVFMSGGIGTLTFTPMKNPGTDRYVTYSSSVSLTLENYGTALNVISDGIGRVLDARPTDIVPDMIGFNGNASVGSDTIATSVTFNLPQDTLINADLSAANMRIIANGLKANRPGWYPPQASMYFHDMATGLMGPYARLSNLRQEVVAAEVPAPWTAALCAIGIAAMGLSRRLVRTRNRSIA